MLNGISVGQQVWVRTGLGTHEEPATVVQIGCPLPEEPDSKEDRNGGIRVKINVSTHEFTISASTVRAMENDPIDGSRSLRRSKRSVVRSNATAPTASNDGRENAKVRNASTSAVTPSTAQSYKSNSEGCQSGDSDNGILINLKATSKRKKKPSTSPSTPKKKHRLSQNKDIEGKESPYFTSSKEIDSKDEKEMFIRRKGRGKGKNAAKSLSRSLKTISQGTTDVGKRVETLSNAKESMVRKPDGNGDLEFDSKEKKAMSDNSKGRRKGMSADKTLACSKNIVSQDPTNEGEMVESLSNENRSMARKPDGNGGLDQPGFTVEYSKSGRATCRRCDERIDKGQLRVGHTPLFRGKPGYTVYRHLHCAVFAEYVLSAEDIDGYSDLETDDYTKLVVRVEESKEEIKREMEELEPDELVQVSFQGEKRASPPGLTANLLPFQVEGVSWMYHQEVKEPTMRGGVLADEMGMGKTLQTIVTILDNRPKLQHSLPGVKHPPMVDVEALNAEEKLWDDALSSWRNEMVMNNVLESILPRGKGNARAGTLVICPLIALSQWKTEIERFTELGKLTVGVYHGPTRSTDTPREILQKFDVVLTTYQVVQADFSCMTSPNRVKCPNCGGRYKVDKLRIHLKYFCGEGAERTELQSRTRRRPGNRRGGTGRGHSRNGNGDSSGKKTKLSKSKQPLRGQSKAPKEKLGVKTKTPLESESELSLLEDDKIELASNEQRPSRTAAKKANKQLLSSATKWIDGSDGEDSDAGYEDETSFIESDDDASSIVSSSVSSEDEGAARKRAKAKQREALLNAKQKVVKGKKSAGEKKRPSKTEKFFEKDKKARTNKQKKSKTGGGNRSSGSRRENEESDNEKDDDIDMEKLVQEAMAGSKMSVLHSICWWRIVLDEAHYIKSRNSQTANAVFALTGSHRWCLSGTPLQNRVGEFYSLIRFLRIDPMGHYFCRKKDCDCKSLHYRMMNGRCQDCGHSSIQHYSHFNKYVLNPIQTDGYSGDGRRAMFTLKNEILDKCLLRRTKETKAEDMNLPPRIVSIQGVRLHPVEEDFCEYSHEAPHWLSADNALYTQTRSSFNDYIADGSLLNNYAHIFDLLMRMRQSVDHPYLVVYSKKDAREQHGVTVANGTTDCDICHEPPTDRVTSTCCQAAFCRSCVLDYMTTLNGANTPCPSCRSPLSIDLNQNQNDVVDDNTLLLDIANEKEVSISREGMPTLKELRHVASGSILRRIDLAEFATSTKIEALTKELVEMRQTSPGSKAIVFSQFVNMLDLIRWRLHSDPYLSDMGLGVRAIHGGMDLKARDASLKDFREDVNVRVLVISLKAGGVALNLTVANHIYLMDPWWNPAAEMQAIDRTHRLGQYRPIRAVRFIAENTVEERILQLQEKKRLVFDGTVGRDAGSLKMLTVDDMKSLFA